MAAKKKSGKSMKCATGGFIDNKMMSNKDMAKASKVNLNPTKMPMMTPKKVGKRSV